MSADLKFSGCATPFAGPFSGVIRAGSNIGLTGPSGSGKSTLLKCFADLVEHQGSISLGGRQQTSTPAAEWRRMVRYLHADIVWWSHRVSDHFSAPGRLDPLLDDLGLESSILDSAADSLSTGESKRLGLLRALQDSPEVVLLDEPASNLDGDNQEKMLNFLTEYHRHRKCTMVVISHEPAWLQRLCHSTVTIQSLRSGS